MTFSAMSKLGGLTATRWRGTTYRGHALDAAEERVAEEGAADGPPPDTTADRQPAK